MAINPRKTLMLICDVQERFRSAIYGFDAMTSSICKLVKATRVSSPQIGAANNCYKSRRLLKGIAGTGGSNLCDRAKSQG